MPLKMPFLCVEGGELIFQKPKNLAKKEVEKIIADEILVTF